MKRRYVAVGLALLIVLACVVREYLSFCSKKAFLPARANTKSNKGSKISQQPQADKAKRTGTDKLSATIWRRERKR